MNLVSCENNDYWAPDCCDSGYTIERYGGMTTCAINVNESCIHYVGDMVRMLDTSCMPGTECVHTGVGDKWYQCIKVQT